MPDWLRLFPDEDFRFRVGLRTGGVESFFAPSPDRDAILAHRRSALDWQPSRYATALDNSLAAVREAASLMVPVQCRPAFSAKASEPKALCVQIGCVCEADWVLLSPDADSGHPVLAGVVCFPSSWSLPEKLGRPIREVHAPVPTVNAVLGRSIDAFLQRLVPGEAWQRENWGFSADDVLDHHPEASTPPLSESVTLETTWLRLESQLFVRMPQTQAILFGIRVEVHRLDSLAVIPGLAPRIVRSLETMSEEIAAYKGLTRCRSKLIAALRGGALHRGL